MKKNARVIGRDKQLDIRGLRTRENESREIGRARAGSIAAKFIIHCLAFRSLKHVPVYNDHPRDPKFVVVVGRWSLFGGCHYLRFDCTIFNDVSYTNCL